jgi:hypothetical protein
LAVRAAGEFSRLPRLDFRTRRSLPVSTILVPSLDLEKKPLLRRPGSSALVWSSAYWRSFSSKVLSERSLCCDEAGRSVLLSPRLDPRDVLPKPPRRGVSDVLGLPVFTVLFSADGRRDRHDRGAGLGDP